MQKIIPHLWFDTQAKEAADFYVSVFPDAKIVSSVVIPDTPSGDCDFITFNVSGQDFMALSAGPDFTLNPSVSFMVNFDPSHDDQAEAHLRELWDKLSDGGSALMPLDAYPYSKLYGWVKDKFGITWQLILTNPDGEPRPFIVPSLMFSGEHVNQAEDAMKFYIETFKDAKVGTVARYPEATGPAKKDALMFADFTLAGQWFAAMDSGVEQDFTFNEAISLLVNCETQTEIDELWGKLSAVPEAEQCGWLKDKFGVVWQISSAEMDTMFREGTPAQVKAMTKAFMPMKKIEIAPIKAAYDSAK